MGKHTAPKGGARGARTSATDITQAERTELMDLAPEQGALPDQPVKRRTYAQRSLIAAARKISAPLYEETDLAPKSLEELERRVSLLERAELAWVGARALRANPKLVAARSAGEVYKRLLMRAFRYFLRRDEEVQARLTLIAHGTGDADLVDDLRKLAQLADRYAAQITKARKRLGANPAETARAHARAIETAGADRTFDAAATEALALRNRAFWHAADLEGDVREAGRYVYEDDAKKLDVFLREERPTGSAGEGEDPADEGTEPEGDLEAPAGEGEDPADEAPAKKAPVSKPKAAPASAKGDAKKPAKKAK